MSASDQERFKTPDKGLAGAFERMMYGPDGMPKPPEPPKPRKSFGEIIGAAMAVAVLLAVLFGLAMGCLAMWLAVTG
jgi:hypothetical protein